MNFQRTLLEFKKNQRTKVVKPILLLSSAFFLTALAPLALAQSEDNPLKFKGDVRLRTELLKKQNVKDRLRQRLRGRLGFSTKANEQVEVAGRLATSQGNKATSTNADLGGKDSSATVRDASEGMKKAMIYLDTFYFNWKASKDFSVSGGKINNPFYRVGGSEMIWDSDLTPEGVGLNYLAHCSDTFEWFVNGAGLWSKENSTAADELVAGIQLGAKQDWNQLSLSGGASYYDFAQTKNEPSNSYTGPYKSIPSDIPGYQLTNLFLDLTLNAGEHPLGLYIDYVTNSKAEDKKSGYTVGIKYNKAKEPGTWDADLYYRRLEPNAIIADLADGDIGYNDVTATRLTLKYVMAKNSITQLSYLSTKQDFSTDTKTNYDVTQADFVFSF